MNSLVVSFFALLAVANAGLLAPSANILQGPSTRTTVVGPDGSAISAVAPGGTIVTNTVPGLTAYSAPVVAASPLAYAAAPVYARSGLVSSGLVASGLGRTILAGPSGTIDTTGPLVGPVAPGLVSSPLAYSYY